MLEVALFDSRHGGGGGGGGGAAGAGAEEETMRCVCVLRSGEFSVYSSRRANPTDKLRRRLASKPLSLS